MVIYGKFDVGYRKYMKRYVSFGLIREKIETKNKKTHSWEVFIDYDVFNTE